jgi:hypothetical protein
VAGGSGAAKLSKFVSPVVSDVFSFPVFDLLPLEPDAAVVTVSSSRSSSNVNTLAGVWFFDGDFHRLWKMPPVRPEFPLEPELDPEFGGVSFGGVTGAGVAAGTAVDDGFCAGVTGAGVLVDDLFVDFDDDDDGCCCCCGAGVLLVRLDSVSNSRLLIPLFIIPIRGVGPKYVR